MLRKQVGNGLLIGLALLVGCNHGHYHPALLKDSSPAETVAPPLAAAKKPPQPPPQDAPQQVAVVPPPPPQPADATVAPDPRPTSQPPDTLPPVSMAPIKIKSTTAVPPPPEPPILSVTPPAEPKSPTEVKFLPPVEPQSPLEVKIVPQASRARAPFAVPEAVVVRITCRQPSKATPPAPAAPATGARTEETGPDLGMPPPIRHTLDKAAVQLASHVEAARGSEAPTGVVQAVHAVQAVKTVSPEVPPVADALVKKTEVEPAPPSTPPLKPGFGCAGDYSWLLGELQYIRSRNVWRLRYLDGDAEDRYGGTVTLVGEGLPHDCQSGQMVRVEGQVVNPDSSDPRPPYWVRKLQVLKPAPDFED
jgi:hypothetical protein